MGKKETEGIDWLLERIRANYPDAEILLFGSRARGDHLKSSDYDLLVLSKSFEGMDFRDRIAAVFELVDRAANVEIICLTHDEFKARRNELSVIGAIAKEGIPA